MYVCTVSVAIPDSSERDYEGEGEEDNESEEDVVYSRILCPPAVVEVMIVPILPCTPGILEPPGKTPTAPPTGPSAKKRLCGCRWEH